MPRLTRKSVLLAKTETTYGTDSVPTGAANAIVIRNLSVTPIATEEASRDIIRSFLGESDRLIANRNVQLSFEVEIQGSGTAGTAPAYGPLLRACAMSETILASALTGTAQAGGANTITLAAGASATDNIYAGLRISITSGTGSGQTGIITAYNGTTKVATVLTNWTTPPTATSQYSIGAGVTYRPVSDTFSSVTLYLNQDGVLHRVTGARGTVELDFTVKQIPVYKFSFTGIYNTVVDAAAPSPIYSGFLTPAVVNNNNTSNFRILGYAGILEALSVNVNNTVDFRAVVGAEYVQITDRRASGQCTFEADTVANFDVFGQALANTNGGLSLLHGTAAGQQVLLSCQRIDIGTPTYGDSNGVVTIQCPYYILPTLGNDEFVIAVL